MKPKSVTLPLLPIPPASLRGNARVHHYKRYKDSQKYKHIAYTEIKRSNTKPITQPVNIIIDIAGSRADIDNIGFSCKAYIDAIVALGIIQDDSKKHVKSITYRHATEMPKGIIIQLKPIHPTHTD